MEHYKMFIDGEFTDAISGEVIESIDPGTGKVFATVSKAGPADAERAIMAARKAFDRGDWSGLAPKDRVEMVYRFADEISKQALKIAVLESMDSGQSIRLSSLHGMVGSGMLRTLGYHAAHEFKWKEEIPFSGNVFAPGREYIVREPLGVCLGISASNFPFTQTLYKICFAIITGNTVVIKTNPFTSISSTVIGEAAKAAELPNGVINILTGAGAELGEVLCTHPMVDKISFTGSTTAGKAILRMGADTIKKTTVELGGKSASIILDDADLEMAATGAAFGTFWHTGQVCESGTRILVPAKIHDEFMSLLKERAESYKVGYQLDPEVHMGPMVSADYLKKVEYYVDLGKKEGATLVSGGHRVEVPGCPDGYYYAPTIFTNVTNDMKIARDEIFGPVVCVIKYETEEEAVAIANDSDYGLGGGIFSTNMARTQKIAAQIQTGTLWINNYHIFCDMAPFGGCKQSGFGREFGEEVMHAYTQVKRIHVNAYPHKDHNFMFWRFMNSEPKLPSILPWNCRTNIVAGKGCLLAIQKEVTTLNASRVLIMSDEGVSKAGLVKKVVDALGDFCVGVYDKIEPDPSTEIVDKAAAYARDLKADCLVSVGGGSVIDATKAVCVVLKNNISANSSINIGRLTEPQIPHIAIPTTAGTGSEVTNAAVITNLVTKHKVGIIDKFIVPDVAILDPQFTTSLPISLTAQTGMDTLTHAIEAVTGAMPSPFADATGLHCIRLVKKWLPIAIEDGKNEEARLQLQYAATLGGWAINMTMTALVHSMAHTLGALYNVPHGLGCGLLLPAVMRFNVDHSTDKLAMVADALGVMTSGMSMREAALAASDDVEGFLKTIKHPTRLRDIGVPEGELMEAAFHALGDPTVLLNARPITDPMQIFELFKQAY